MKAVKEHVTHLNQAFRYIHFSTDVFRGRWHQHPQVELTWIERGAGIRFVADNAAPFGAGDMVLLGENVPHLWKGSAVPGLHGATATAIQFPASLIQQPAWPELQRLRPIIERAGVGLQITGPAHARIAAALQAMRDLPALHRLAALVTIFGHLAEGAQDLVAIGTSPVVGAGLGLASAKRIHRVIDGVQQNLHLPLPVAAAAELVHITPEAFSRYFRRQTGKTYTAYVNEVRCSAACLRLRATDQPIAQIAEDCGFRTLSNFNRRFLAWVGMTPGRYRRQV
jgi:AraC-like DNA-binding protein